MTKFRMYYYLLQKQGAELRNEPAIYRCDICNFDTLKNEDELAIHKEMHIGLSPLQCVVCKIEFREKKNIRPHMRLHVSLLQYCIALKMKLQLYIC